MCDDNFLFLYFVNREDMSNMILEDHILYIEYLKFIKEIINFNFYKIHTKVNDDFLEDFHILLFKYLRFTSVKTICRFNLLFSHLKFDGLFHYYMTHSDEKLSNNLIFLNDLHKESKKDFVDKDKLNFSQQKKKIQKLIVRSS